MLNGGGKTHLIKSFHKALLNDDPNYNISSDFLFLEIDLKIIFAIL